MHTIDLSGATGIKLHVIKLLPDAGNTCGRVSKVVGRETTVLAASIGEFRTHLSGVLGGVVVAFPWSAVPRHPDTRTHVIAFVRSGRVQVSKYRYYRLKHLRLIEQQTMLLRGGVLKFAS